MKAIIFFAIFLTGILIQGPVAACQFDTDCNPGSKCIKKRGSIYGVCVGGIAPGNRNDKKPVYAPLDPHKTYGDTCQFDTDCGPGSKCVKRRGSIYGTCMKKR